VDHQRATHDRAGALDVWRRVECTTWITCTPRVRHGHALLCAVPRGASRVSAAKRSLVRTARRIPPSSAIAPTPLSNKLGSSNSRGWVFDCSIRKASEEGTHPQRAERHRAKRRGKLQAKLQASRLTHSTRTRPLSLVGAAPHPPSCRAHNPRLPPRTDRGRLPLTRPSRRPTLLPGGGEASSSWRPCRRWSCSAS